MVNDVNTLEFPSEKMWYNNPAWLHHNFITFIDRVFQDYLQTCLDICLGRCAPYF